MKLTYDNDTCEIKYNGVVIGEWNDNANQDYPEDLSWNRDIGRLVSKIFESGFIQGKLENESKLAKAREVLKFIEAQ